MRRRAVQGANWGLFLLLCLALYGIVNYLAFRHYRRWDWSAASVFSLSPQTQKVLKGLDRPLEVVVFLAPNDELYDRVKNLLSAYQEAGGGRVKVEYIDPDRQKDRLQILAKKYQVAVANVVVFSSGDQSKYVEKDQMVEYDFSAYQYGAPPKVKAFKGEEAFTNALLAVVEPAKPTLYFTVGHGERYSETTRGQGVSLLRDRLQREGATIKEFPTLGKDAVPADASLVVVSGPQYAFTTAEADLLGRYLDRGGRLLVFADPLLSEGKKPAFLPTGLEPLLARWGVVLQDAIAIDPEGAVVQLGAQTFYAGDLSPHPVTRDLSKNALPLVFARARRVGTGAPANAASR